MFIIDRSNNSRRIDFTLSSSSHCPMSILLGGFGGNVDVFGGEVVVLEKIFKSQRPLLTLTIRSSGPSFEVSGELKTVAVMISTRKHDRNMQIFIVSENI